MTFKMRRAMGITLAALTVTAGVSAVAFAGEPDTGKAAEPAAAVMKALNLEVRTNEDGGQEYSLDGVTWEKLVLGENDKNSGVAMLSVKPAERNHSGVVKMEMKELTSLEAVEMTEAYQIKTDEETGITYFSADGGVNWEPADENASFHLDSDITSVPAAELVPATEAIPASKLVPEQEK